MTAAIMRPTVEADYRKIEGLRLAELPGIKNTSVLPGVCHIAGLAHVSQLIYAAPFVDGAPDRQMMLDFLASRKVEMQHAIAIIEAVDSAADPAVAQNSHPVRPSLRKAIESHNGNGKASAKRGRRHPEEHVPEPQAVSVGASPAADELLIPVDQIVPSPLNPRKTFDKAKLQELAASIESKGVLQPILVRKQTVPAGGKLDKFGVVETTGRYEIIFGERRWRAAKLAGLPAIRARVVDFTDKEVLEVQVIENEQRDDVPPLEKADGYAKLIDRHGYTVEDLAKKIGKSTGTIYNLLKLRQLPKEAKKAVLAGELPTATAQLIARIPDEKARAQAAKEILKGGWDGPYSFREAKEHIEEAYMVELKGATFDRQALDLVPNAGACTACPKMTGNNRALYPEARGDICTDPACYRTKVDAHNERRTADLRAAGVVLLEGQAAQRASYSSDYLRLDEKCWEDKKHRTYAQLLKKAIDDGAVERKAFIDQHDDRIRELVPRGAGEKLLKEAGILKRRSDVSSHSSANAAHNAKAKLRAAARKLVMAAAAANVEARMRPVAGLCGEQHTTILRAIAAGLVEHSWHSWHDTAREINSRRGIEAKKAKHSGWDQRRAIEDLIPTLDAGQVLGLLAELVATRFAPESGFYASATVSAAGQRFFKAIGVDYAKSLAQVKREQPVKKGKKK